MFFFVFIFAAMLGVIWYRSLYKHNDLSFYDGEAKTPEKLKEDIRLLATELSAVNRHGSPLLYRYIKRGLYKERKRINYPLYLSELEKVKVTRSLPSADKLPRVYLFAREVVKGTRAAFTNDDLKALLDAFQAVTPLYYSEIAALKAVFTFALCEFSLSVLRSNKSDAEKFVETVNASRALKTIKNAFGISCAKFYETLMKEKSGVFAAMDEESREYYIKEISRLSERHNIAENEIAVAAVELADKNNTHAGEYLFDRRAEMLLCATGKNIRVAGENRRQRRYTLFVMLSGFFVSLIVMTTFTGGTVAKLIVGQLAFFVSFNALKVVVNAILSAVAAEKFVPRIEMKDFGEDDAALVLMTKEVFSAADVLDGYNKIAALGAEIPYNNLAYGILYLLPPSKKEFDEETESALISYAEELISGGNFAAKNKYSFFARRRRAGSGFEVKKGASLVSDVCGYFLRGEKDNFISIGENAFQPKYLITLEDADTLPARAVLDLAAAAKHPQNQKYNMFMLNEKPDPTKSRRTGYGRLFSEGRGVYSDIDAANRVCGNVFLAGVFSAPRNSGAGLVRMREFYDICRATLPKKREYVNFTLPSAFAGTARLSDSYIFREYPTTFSKYCKEAQNYVFGSFQLFPFIYTKVRGADGKKRKLPPLYGFIVFDGINSSLMNISNFLLLAIAVLTGEVLPVLLVAAGYLLVPLINIIYQIVWTVKGRRISEFPSGVLKSLLRAAFSFSVLPFMFFLSLAAILRAFANLFARKNQSPAPVVRTEQKSFFKDILFLLPNFLTAALFFAAGVSGGALPLMCSLFWFAAVFVHHPMGKKQKVKDPQLPSDTVSYISRIKKKADTAEFGLIEALNNPDINLWKDIKKIQGKIKSEKMPLLGNASEIITEITETPKYNYMTNGGYSVVFDEAGAGLSSFEGTLINKYGAVPSSCGTFISVNDESPIPDKAVFNQDFTAFEYKKDSYETTVKTVLLPFGAGELRQIVIKNTASAERVFELKIKTEYSLSELGTMSNQSTGGKIEPPEFSGNCVVVEGGKICVAEFLRGTEGDFSFKNNVLTISANVKAEAGGCAEIWFVRICASDKNALFDTLKKTRSYGFLESALKCPSAYAEPSDSDESVRRAVLGKLMLSGLCAKPKQRFFVAKTALRASDSVFSARRGFTVLVKVDETRLRPILSALIDLYKTGFKFTAVFLTDAKSDYILPCNFFVVQESELSGAEREYLLSLTDFVVDGIGDNEVIQGGQKAEYYTKNKLKHAKDFVLPLARPERNILTDKQLAAVAEATKNFTLSKNLIFTRNEILYIADRAKESFYTVTADPLCADGTDYTVGHENGVSTFGAENKTEKTVMSVKIENGAKIFETVISDKSGKKRKMSAVMYFEIDGISGYSFKKTEGQIEIFSAAGESFFLSFPEPIEYTFSHGEFFGRLNGIENPRGVLEELRGGEGAAGCLAVKVNFDIAGGKEKVLNFSLSKNERNEPREEIENSQSIEIFTGSPLDQAGGRECLNTLTDGQNLLALGFCGGAGAFDNPALLYHDTVAVKNNILALCRNQLMRGDMRSSTALCFDGDMFKNCDNALSLPLVVAEYIEITGDAAILDITTRYCRPRGVREDNPAYDGEIGERVYNHCLRALRFFKIGDDGLVLSKQGGDAEQSILYFSVAKKFLKYVTNSAVKIMLIENMEKIREALSARLLKAPENDLKMYAYLAGLLDLYDRPAAKSRTEEYIDLWICEHAAKKDYSALLYKLIVNRVLGIRFCGDKISLRPFLMKNLDSARARISRNGSIYEITVLRSGERKMTIDGVSYVNLEYIPIQSGEKKVITAEI